MTTAVRLPQHLAHPFAPAGRRDPYPAYRWLQTHAPVHFDAASRMWLVTGHAACAQVLRDPACSAAQGQRERDRDEALPPSMLTTDAPDHQRLRAPGALLLGPAALRSVADGLADGVDALMDALTRHGGRIDALATLGTPVASLVFARLFGLPEEERDRFARLAKAASVNLDPTMGPAAAAAGRTSMGELTRYLDSHTSRLLRDGTACPLTALAADERLSRAEVLGILGLAVVGGWQPLAEMVGNALYWLMPRPDLVARLRADGPAAARTAVDELLRLEAPIPFTARVAVRDVDLPGGTVPAGGRMLAVLAAANRDPAVFDRPDEPVLDRSPNPHLAFGGGPHFCLAAQLVRQVGALLLPALFLAFPGLRATAAAPEWAPSMIPRRLLGYPLDLRPTDPEEDR